MGHGRLRRSWHLCPSRGLLGLWDSSWSQRCSANWPISHGTPQMRRAPARTFTDLNIVEAAPLVTQVYSIYCRERRNARLCCQTCCRAVKGVQYVPPP